MTRFYTWKFTVNLTTAKDKKDPKMCSSSSSSHCFRKPRNKNCNVLRCDPELQTWPSHTPRRQCHDYCCSPLYSMLPEIRHLLTSAVMVCSFSENAHAETRPFGWKEKQESCSTFCSVQKKAWVLSLLKSQECENISLPYNICFLWR